MRPEKTPDFLVLSGRFGLRLGWWGGSAGSPGQIERRAPVLFVRQGLAVPRPADRQPRRFGTFDCWQLVYKS